MSTNLNTITEKAKSLTSEQLAEVENFIEFISFRAQDRELAQSAATVSSPAFEAIWDNTEDSAYDAL